MVIVTRSHHPVNTSGSLYNSEKFGNLLATQHQKENDQRTGNSHQQLNIASPPDRRMATR
ncbi:12417_t:CDS:2, partial [Ambispora gerdemannii]